MNKIIVSLTAVTFAASGLVGCANMTETQRDTSIGAGIGAGAGGMAVTVRPFLRGYVAFKMIAACDHPAGANA